jgi:hypothetical protein
MRGMGLRDSFIADLEAKLFKAASPSRDEQEGNDDKDDDDTDSSDHHHWPPRLLCVKRRWGGGGYPAKDLLEDGEFMCRGW